MIIWEIALNFRDGQLGTNSCSDNYIMKGNAAGQADHVPWVSSRTEAHLRACPTASLPALCTSIAPELLNKAACLLEYALRNPNPLNSDLRSGK